MPRLALVGLLLALSSAACDERGRTRNSGGTATLETERVARRNIYRFVDVDKALADAKKAVSEERWDDVAAAAAELLAREPGHLEGRRLADLAAFEGPNLTRFTELRKALEERTVSLVAASFHAIGDGSRYQELARPDYEKVREQWVLVREADARSLVRAGRCRDAHRVARSANDLFPEMRPRLDVAAGNCRPATNQDEPDPEPPPAASAPVASLQPVPETPPEPEPLAEAEPTPEAAPEPPSPTPAPPPPPTPVVPPPPPPLPAAPARPAMITPTDLEPYRNAGEKRPALTAGARMIATRDRVKQIAVGIGLCVSAAGLPTSVELLRPSDYNDANEKIVDDVKKWRFRPVLVDGKPSAVCTRLVFLYQLE